MDAGREVFARAPLAMVVAEIKYSYSQKLLSPGAQAAVLASVARFTPIVRREQQETVEFQVGAGGASTPTTQSIEVMNATSLDGQRTAAVTPQDLTLAMSGSAYTKFEDSLRPFIESAVSGLSEVVGETYLTRVGLRYLDEIRVPEPPSDVMGWSRWVDPELLGGSKLLVELGGVSSAARSVWQYALPNGVSAVLNMGPFFGVGIVGPEHPFHRSSPPTSMFILDLDASWTPPSGAALLNVKELMSRYDELHKPSQVAFQRTVTDDARDLFRGRTS